MQFRLVGREPSKTSSILGEESDGEGIVGRTRTVSVSLKQHELGHCNYSIPGICCRQWCLGKVSTELPVVLESRTCVRVTQNHIVGNHRIGIKTHIG